ncbi:MAG TPA: hypothetical protein VFC34_08930 [Puia sp.]|nr:hypothetical protein [Puia sp.]
MNKELISVAEARTLVAARVDSLEPVKMAIERALGLEVAEDVYAPLDTPAFDQSSMDGYAIRFEDRAEPLTLQGEMPAGSAQPIAETRK